MLKNNLVLIFILVTMVSCQLKRKHTPPQGPQVNSPTAPWSPEAEKEEPPSPGPVINSGVTPKIGLILGPGALRAYAHVGLLQEFAKAKLQIQALVGIETGSLVAAIYANKGQPFDVEWQMMKLTESDWYDKAFLSREIQASDVSKNLGPFMNSVFGTSKVENARIAFGCPAFNLSKKQVFIMNRGVFGQMLPYCLAFPPLYKPHHQNVAGISELKSAIDFLRTKGANYVIYINLLSGPLKLPSQNISTQVLWNMADQNLQQKERGLDEIINVPVQNFDLFDFGKRRELIQKGQQTGQQEVGRIMKKLGL
jgi:NTE family protein